MPTTEPRGNDRPRLGGRSPPSNDSPWQHQTLPFVSSHKQRHFELYEWTCSECGAGNESASYPAHRQRRLHAVCEICGSVHSQDRVREQRLDALAEHPPSTPTTSSQGALSLAHSAYNASESAQFAGGVVRASKGAAEDELQSHTPHVPSTDTVYERLRGVAREEEGSTEKIREIVEEEEVGEVEEEDDWQLMRTLSLAEEDAVLCLRRQRLAHFKVFQPPVGPS